MHDTHLSDSVAAECSMKGRGTSVQHIRRARRVAAILMVALAAWVFQAVPALATAGNDGENNTTENGKTISDVVPAAATGPLDGVNVSTTRGPYQIRALHSGKCLDNPHGTSTPGVQQDQYTCVTGASNEKWYIVPVPESVFCPNGPCAYNPPGPFWIKNAGNGLCLNVDHGYTAPNTKVLQWTCGNYKNEFFGLRGSKRSGGHRYDLIATWLPVDNCLNIAGGSTANNAKLITWPCGDYNNEYFDIYGWDRNF